jgi:hypothetical protein
MEMNRPRSRFSRRQERSLLREAAEAVRSEFNILERTGCPSPETLNLLARRNSSLPESPDLIDHIATCSPCFVEYSRHRAAHNRRVWISTSCACAAALVVLLLAIMRLLPGTKALPEKSEIADGAPEVEQILDLRQRGVSRGDDGGQPSHEVPRLRRAKIDLSIYLPVGSEEGSYDIALINASGQPITMLSGQVRLENFVEVLLARLDLTRVSPGSYELRLRRTQGQWNSYSILVE